MKNKTTKKNNNNTKTRRRPSLEESAQIAALVQHGRVKMSRLQEMFPQYSRRTLYRHAGQNMARPANNDNRRRNPGRPRKLSNRDIRKLERCVLRLRKTEGPNFSAARVRVRAGLTHVSTRTICRHLNQAGYKYLQSRRKGLLNAPDLKKRLSFCKEMKKKPSTYWSHDISFYLDAKGFQYKTNPFDQAKAPASRIWRKRSEGLEFGLTAKGSKVGTTNLNFMVGIAHSKGVVLCTPYEGSITAAKMEAIVENHFDTAFKKCNDPKARKFLMDNCPRQKAKRSYAAYEKAKSSPFLIPPRSPDLNPIETFFHQMSRKLSKQAIEEVITHETKEEFKERVMNTMLSFPADKITKIIDTMPKRINEVVRLKGKRTKY